MKPGIYKGMKDADYRAIEAVNVSSLKEMRKSEKHYLHELDKEQERKDAFDIGNAFHYRVLEPHRYSDDVLVLPDLNLRTKAGREEKARLIKENPGKAVIKEYDDYRIKQMSHAVKKHKVAQPFLAHAVEKEVVAIWEEGDILCKAKIDMVVDHPDHGLCLVDLKSSICASPSSFGMSIAEYGYFLQGAFYLNGFAKANGKPAGSFWWIVCEKEEPYGVGVYRQHKDDIHTGTMVYKSFLERLSEARNTGHFTGYHSQPVRMTDWQRMKWMKDVGI
jgi:hypothetical protein